MNLFVWLLFTLASLPFFLAAFFFISKSLGKNNGNTFENDENVRYLKQLENKHKLEANELRRKINENNS